MSTIRYKLDYYVPCRTVEQRETLWFRNMRDLAIKAVRKRLELQFVELGGSSPFEIFIRTHRINVEHMCEKEYHLLCRKYWYELERVNGNTEKYQERLEEEKDEL